MLIRETSLQKKHRISRGFSLIEVMIVVLIVAILTTVSLMGITRARSSFQFSNAVGVLQVNLERAVADARRRNARGDARATVRVLSTRSYQVRTDFDGDGTLDAQTVELPEQISFLYEGTPPQATIDWRGYVAEGTVNFVLRSSSGQISQVRLTGRGDASADNGSVVLPTVTVSPISSDVRTSTVLAGNSSPNPNISPTPTPTPLPVCTNEELPANNNCRCKPGKIIDNDGKCK